MYLLRVLGGLSLEDPSGPVVGRAGQRRQLVLLAALALARGRAVSRDRLIGTFWPEAGADRARRQLSDAVYLIRRELGDGAVQTVGDDLRLGADALTSDLASFEDALAAGELRTAVERYGGPLLDGVYWDDSPEWERQVDAERERLARAYAAALEGVAAAAARAGDLPGAAEAWRRRAAHDPLDARVCARLMEALAAAGDRAGALQQARVHAALLREELDAGPDAAVQALAERLRHEPAATEPTTAPAPAEPPARSALPAAPDPPPSETSRGAGAAAPRARRHAAWPIAMVALLALALAAWLSLRGDEPSAAADRVLVLPFAAHGGEQAAYLGEGLVDLLSVTLDGAGAVRTVDPRAVLYHARQTGPPPLEPAAARALAARLGAERHVQGTVTQAGSLLRISATLYASDGAAVGSATVEGLPDDLFSLVDRLSAELLALHAGAPAARLERLAARTTGSLPALRAYLAAEAAFRQRAQQWEPEVVDAFRRAVALDSTFALAHYRLSVAAAWVGDAGLSRSAGGLAARHAERLGRRDRELLDAWQARLAGDADAAEQRYRSLLARYPDDVEAWWQLAELTIRAAPFRGDSVTAAADAYRRVLELDPTHGCARCSLIFIELQRGALAAAEALAAGSGAGHSVPSPALRLLRALERGDSAARRAVLRELRDEPVWSAHEAHFRARMWGSDPGAAVEAGRLVDAPRFPAEWRGITRILLVDEELARGRPAAAHETLRRARELEPGWALVLEALVGLGPVAPATPEERARLLARVEAWRPDTTAHSRGYFTASHNEIYPELRLYLLGLLRAAQGDARGADSAVAALDAFDSGVARYLAAGVRGWLPPEERALEYLDARARMLPAEHVWLTPALGAPLERLRHAALLERAGRTDEALRLLAAFGQNPWDIAYLAPAALRRAQLLERLGRRAEAAAQYERFADLWSDAEPVLRPQAEAARLRARELRGGG